MAKLRALLCLAICFMVALIATVTATSPRDHFDGSKELEKIKEIEAIDRNERSQKQWEDLAKGYVEMFRNTGEANKMSIDEVVRSFDSLIGAMKGAFAYTREWIVEVPNSWRVLWYLRANLGPMKQGACNTEKIGLISQLVNENRRCPWQLNYVLGCFRDYLEKCGYEKSYKEAVKSMDDADLNLATYPTLDSYLNGEVWAESGLTHGILDSEIESIIETFEDIAALERVGAKIICKSSYLRMLKENMSKLSKSFKLAKYHARLYARKCGLEDYYKKEIDRMQVLPHRPFAGLGPRMGYSI